MLGWVCAAPIHAAESGFGVGLSLAHDSNIARVETNPKSDWTGALLAGLFYRENTLDVTARVAAQVERRHYYYHTFPDDTTAYVDGAAVWRISPRQLTWTVEDTFRLVQLNLTAPNTPSNLTNSNTVSTGPDFTFLLSPTNSVVIGGRYGRFDIQHSMNDNQRYTAYVRGVHALSAQAKVSLNYEAGKVFFEPGAQVYSQIFREDLFGRFENRSAMNTTTIDIGTSRVTTYGGPANCVVVPVATPLPSPCKESSSSLEPSRLARLTLSETLSSQSALRLVLSDQVSDTYTDLLGGVISSTAPKDPGVVVPTVPTFSSGDLYHSRRVDLAYANNDGRFGYTLQTYGRRVAFVTLTEDDYLEKGGTFLWTWTFSGAAQLNATATYVRRTYESLDRQDTDRTYGVNGIYKLSSNVIVTMDVARFERQSTVPLNSYVDNRVVLALGYISGLGITGVRSGR